MFELLNYFGNVDIISITFWCLYEELYFKSDINMITNDYMITNRRIEKRDMVSLKWVLIKKVINYA